MAKQNQAQVAYEKIREKLISRVFEPGQRLIERVWSENFNAQTQGNIHHARHVGPSAVQPAGQQLAFYGGEGPYSTPAEMSELNEIRVVLESAAAKLAINRATKGDIAQLAKICEHMRLMVENEYKMGVSEADLKFHETLIKSAHNSKLEFIYKTANLPLSMHMPPTITKEQLISEVAGHVAIVEALKKKNLPEMLNLLTCGLA